MLPGEVTRGWGGLSCHPKSHPTRQMHFEERGLTQWSLSVIKAKGNGSYKLETLEGGPIPRSCNAANLKFYFN